MALDRDQVQHIAALARIGLTEEELERLQEQLSHIVEQFEVLKELDANGGTPTVQGAEAPATASVMRDDVADDSLDPEEVLRNAPRREGEFFRVKAVLEE